MKPTPDDLRDIAHRCRNWPCEADVGDLEYAAAALLACARILELSLPEPLSWWAEGVRERHILIEGIINEKLEKAHE